MQRLIFLLLLVATLFPLSSYAQTYQSPVAIGAANGVASLDGSSKIPIAQVPTGSTSSTVALGNDSRLSDARTPTAHATSHLAGGSDPLETTLVLAGQVSTGADVNLVDITGVAFTATAGGIYSVTIFGAVNNAAATTGYGIGVNCAQTPQIVWLTGGSQLANTGTESQWSAIANNAIIGVTSGVPTNATDVPVFGGGIIKAHASTPGTCTFRFRSETTAAARIQAGSVFIIKKVG